MAQKNVINIHCGKMIYQIRKTLKYNQDELASAIGLTRTSVVNIEKGNQGLTVENLLKLCAVLKCTPADILPQVPKVSLKPMIKIKKVVEEKRLKSSFKW